MIPIFSSCACLNASERRRNERRSVGSTVDSFRGMPNFDYMCSAQLVVFDFDSERRRWLFKFPRPSGPGRFDFRFFKGPRLLFEFNGLFRNQCTAGPRIFSGWDLGRDRANQPTNRKSLFPVFRRVECCNQIWPSFRSLRLSNSIRSGEKQ